MSMRNLALFVLVVLFPSALASADNRPKRESKAELISRLADYKSWKQVNRVDQGGPADSFTIANSFPGG